MRRAGLRARLEKLESKRQSARRFRRVIYSIVGTELDDCLGFQAGNLAVLRNPGESMTDCAKRAFASTGCVVIGSILPKSGSGSAAESEEAVKPSLPATNVGSALREAPSDPFALAGVGKRATAEQLARMIGGVPVERLL